MKKLIMALFLFTFFSVPLIASSVNLAWDASASQVDGYMLFDRNFQKPYDYNTPSWVGAELTGAVVVPDDRQSAFVARAFVWGVYDLDGNRIKIPSDNSNEVVFTPESKPKPAPPRNFFIKILVAVLGFLGRLLG